MVDFKVKRFNSAQEKAGGLLLKEALKDKEARREASNKDIAQGAKEIASDLGCKFKGTVIFVPSETYQKNYEQIKWR
jgi:hypothetical protein